jgi:hypothetical protein
MSLSPSTLSSIQQAGQGLHAARLAVASEVQSNAERVVASLASQPFSPELDQAYTQLRSVARMAHELQALEDQLKALYSVAAEKATSKDQVLIALPNHLGYAKSHLVKGGEGAEDAIAKAPVVRKSKPKTPKTGKSDKPARLSPNDMKVLAYLKTVLDRRSWQSITHATLSQASEIPLGSVGNALRRLIASGSLLEDSKGAYRLP